MAFRKKSLRRPNHNVLLFLCNTKLRQRLQILPDGARPDFHECQRLAIVTDEIDLALDAARSVIPRHEYVPLPPQIPVGIGFSANAGAPSFLLFRIAGKTLLFTQASPRRPVQSSKHQV